MRTGYTLYPEALEKIKKAGINERLKKYKDEGNSYSLGHVYKDDIMYSKKALIEEGYYKTMPTENNFDKAYHKRINEMLFNELNHPWVIERPEGSVKEKTHPMDILLMLGVPASIVLEPEEMWDYKKFNFSSPTELITTIGAYVIQSSKGIFTTTGRGWKSKRKNGSELLIDFTACGHGDPRVVQKDIAEYPTIDPHGNKSLFRPELDIEKKGLYCPAYEESAFLVTVMKYIEQENIPAKFLKDNAKELVEWGTNIRNERCGSVDSPELFFSGFEYDLPKIRKDGTVKELSRNYINSANKNIYGAYISQEGNLAYCMQTMQRVDNPSVLINMEFTPEDMDDMVKGIVYQCAKSLGRTSINQILSIIEYKYQGKE